jgi:hypothetical protein
MIGPPENSWHQHFNVAAKPARYLALRAFGSKKFHGVGKTYQGSVDRKKASTQIENHDEDPLVRHWFEAALAQRGVQSQMAKHYEKSG